MQKGKRTLTLNIEAKVKATYINILAKQNVECFKKFAKSMMEK